MGDGRWQARRTAVRRAGPPTRAGRALHLVGVVALLLACNVLIPSGAGAAVGDITTVAGNGTAVDAGDGGLATAAGTGGPAGVAFDAAGDLYVADATGHRVRRVTTATGIISTVAGTGVSGSTGDGGPATAATLATPVDVTFDAAGNLLVADYGAHVIRRVAPGGTITTVAGTAGVAGYAGDDGPASGALLRQPAGLDVDAAGNVYVADMGNNAVRRIDPNGVITTIAGGKPGSLGDGGPARSARLRTPADVAVAPDGSYVIADYGNHKIRKVDAAGTISTVAGTGTAGYSGDGGPATSATLNGPTGIEIDSAGSLFIAEYANHTIRGITPSGTIRTVAGKGGVPGFAGDGGSATLARLNQPARVILDRRGDFFIPDLANNRVRRIVGLGVPDAPVLDPFTSPTSPSNANTFLVRGTAPPGTTVRLFTDATCTTLAASGDAATFGAGGLALTVADDSTTQVHAVAVDTDGRTSGCSVSSATYVEDSIRPAAPTITGWPASPSGAATAQWSFTVAEGAAACTLTGPDGGVVAGPSACGGTPASYVLDGRPDGTYLFSVTTTDAAGNVSDAATSAYERDTAAPAAPTITSKPLSPSRFTSLTWSFTGAGAPTCSLVGPDGAGVPGGDTCATGTASYDVAGLDDGTYAFTVLLRDEAGNASAAEVSTVLLDTTPPVPPAPLAAPASPGHEARVSWSFSLTEGTPVCELHGPDGVEVASSAWCGAAGTAAYDLSALEDGRFDLTVVAVDEAGNRSVAWESAYVLDRRPPAAPTIVSSPPAADDDPTIRWTFTVAEGTPSCALVAPDGSAVPATGPCAGGAAAFDLTGLDDGNYAFLVFSTDAADNPSPDASGSYRYDTTPPPVPELLDGPDSPTADRAMVWTYRSTEGAILCSLTGPDGAAVDGTCTDGTASFTVPSGRPDGDYVLAVVAVDDVGNASAPASSTVVLDTTAPPAPVLVAVPPTPSNDPTLVWTYHLDEGTVDCALVGPDGPVTSGSCGPAAAGFDLTTGSDGSYAFVVSAVDAAGNRSSTPAPSHVLDTLAPPRPTITSSPSTPGLPRAVAWRFDAAEGTPACSLSGPDGAVAGGADCGTGVATYDLAAAADGTYAFRVTAADDAGNRSTVAASVIELVTPPPTTTTRPLSTTVRRRPLAIAPAPTSEPPAGAAPEEAPAEAPTAETTPPPTVPPLPRIRPNPLPAADTADPGTDSHNAALPVLRIAGAVAERSTLPMSLLLVVTLFLLVQDRVDRNDPKLALAPVYPDPELSFGPRPSDPHAHPSPGAHHAH